MALWVTDRGLAEVAPLEGLGVEGIEEALSDASRVYTYVRRNEWITEADLREYAERNDLPPDQLNRALEILRATGRLFVMQEAAELPGDGIPNSEESSDGQDER